MSTASVTVLAPSDTVLTSTPCAKCGNHISHPELQTLQNAQARIAELESQVKILTLRATSAVERATEYEVSLRRVTSNAKQQAQQSNPQVDEVASQSSAYAAPAAVSRLARYLSTRSNMSTASEPARTSSAPPNSALQPSSPLSADAASLQAALEEEQSLRKAAESAAAKTNSELEELTGELFERANEMVAQERKARAKLEARVEVLEKRDNDKAKRLGLLEMRVQRVERVRGLLNEKTPS